MKRGQAQSNLLALIGGVLVFVVFTLAFLYFLRGGQQAYTVPVNETQFAGFNQSTQIINLTQQTQQQFIQLNGTGTSTLDIISVMTTGGYNTLKIIGGIPAIYGSFIGGIASILGIPAEIANLFFAFVVTVIIVVFILLVFRVRS